jgi:exopolysaccharide production protein ExoQ
MIDNIKKDDFALIPPLVGISFTAITTLIMAYSYLINVIPILVMYLMWFPFLYYKKTIAVKISYDVFLPLLFVTYCVLSFTWSDYPTKTLYSSIQYMSMVICAMIITRRVSFEDFLRGISIGVFLVLICTFRTGEFSFSGLFGSKNQVGFFAQIGLIVSAFILFTSSSNFLQKFIFFAPTFILSLVCLILSKSVSSIISVTAVLAICITCVFIGKISRINRPIILSMMLLTFVTAALTLVLFDINPQTAILEFFGKDSTLTGRTDLWEAGITYFLNNPIFGNGYLAFWVEGRPEAEALWEEFYIFNKTGFHFHNLFIQTLVDLGLIGLFLLLLPISVFLFKSIQSLILNGSNLKTIFCISLSFMFLTRAFVEVDILNAFGIGPLLFYSMYPRVYSMNKSKHG